MKPSTLRRWLLSIPLAMLAGVAVAAPQAQEPDHATAIFAGGCFWCVESDFDKLDGVISAERFAELSARWRSELDEIERAVTWRGNSDVGALAGRPVRLRFVMKDADLYSIRFAAEPPKDR